VDAGAALAARTCTSDGGAGVDSRAGAGSFDEQAATANAAQMIRTRTEGNMLRVL